MTLSVKWLCNTGERGKRHFFPDFIISFSVINSYLYAMKKWRFSFVNDNTSHVWHYKQRWLTQLFWQQQEQDPTNLYIANLPPNFKEADLDSLLSKYGQVISTRILRDSQGINWIKRLGVWIRMSLFRYIEGSRFRSYGVQREVRANNSVIQQQLFD